MATIHSNANGQVVEVLDEQGKYYYVADGLGEPTVGGFSDRDAAVSALDAGGIEPDVRIDALAYRLGECLYCKQEVRCGEPVPAEDDEAGWAEAAKGHDEDCEWVATRAHRVKSR